MNQHNPLHSPQPPESEIIFQDKFRMLHPSLELVDFGAFKLLLTRTRIWLSEELSIPLHLIQKVELAEKGWIMKMLALRLTYRNPANDALESVAFSKVNFLGLCIRKPVEELKEVVETLVESAGLDAKLREAKSETADVAEPELQTKGERVCEGCGSTPCHYVSYVYLVSVLHFAYRSGERRRLHCAGCNLKMGVPDYLVTMLVGWPGAGIFQYPFILYKSSSNLKPAIGNLFWALFVVPIVLLILLILRVCGVI